MSLNLNKPDLTPTYKGVRDNNNRSEVERVLASNAISYEERNDHFSLTDAQLRMENGERLIMLAGVQGGKFVSG